MAELHFDSLVKIYPSEKGEILAVDDLNLRINDGEIIGLLGSSGCGKTTTLRSVAGFVTPTSGQINMNGNQIHNLPPSQRQVAMAFEGYALYPPLKIRDNIGFALLQQKKKDSEVKAEVEKIANLLEIEDILDSYPAAISAGQQQRTSLARALIRKASVTLLDEPMSQLEPRLRTILRARVKEYLVENKQTTIFVTHDQNEAITLADRIAVMEQGKLLQFDSAITLRDKPANMFVAEFIGEPPMNIIDAETSSESGDQVLNLVHEQTKFGQVESNLSTQTNKLKLGIRPHRIQIANDGQIKAKVISNQWLGDQAHLLVDCQGKRLVVVSTTKHSQYNVDADISLNIPSEALLYFDPESGNALQ